MAKTRETPRHEPISLGTKVQPMPMTQEAFRKQVEEFWLWTASRPRLSTNWWQSMREFANMKFNEAYDKEMK